MTAPRYCRACGAALQGAQVCPNGHVVTIVATAPAASSAFAAIGAALWVMRHRPIVFAITILSMVPLAGYFIVGSFSIGFAALHAGISGLGSVLFLLLLVFFVYPYAAAAWAGSVMEAAAGAPFRLQQFWQNGILYFGKAYVAFIVGAILSVLWIALYLLLVFVAYNALQAQAATVGPRTMGTELFIGIVVLGLVTAALAVYGAMAAIGGFCRGWPGVALGGQIALRHGLTVLAILVLSAIAETVVLFASSLLLAVPYVGFTASSLVAASQSAWQALGAAFAGATLWSGIVLAIDFVLSMAIMLFGFLAPFLYFRTIAERDFGVSIP